MIFTFSIVILMVVYQFKWLPTYNIEQGYEVLLNPKEWWNDECDKMFQEKIDKNNFKIIEYGPEND